MLFVNTFACHMDKRKLGAQSKNKQALKCEDICLKQIRSKQEQTRTLTQCVPKEHRQQQTD